MCDVIVYLAAGLPKSFLLRWRNCGRACCGGCLGKLVFVRFRWFVWRNSASEPDARQCPDPDRLQRFVPLVMGREKVEKNLGVHHVRPRQFGDNLPAVAACSKGLPTAAPLSFAAGKVPREGPGQINLGRHS